MTHEIKTGGPAFPVIAGLTVHATGLNLRDAVAIAALPAVIKDYIGNGDYPGEDDNAHFIVVQAFSIADAFMAQRDV